MRIAVLPSWYSTPKSPLTGVYFDVQAAAIAETADVSIVCLRKALFPYYKKQKKGRLSVYDFYTFYFPKLNEYFLKKWAEKYSRRIKKLHREQAFDLLHAHDHVAAYAAYLASKDLGIPYVVTLHSTQFLTGEIDTWRHDYIRRILVSSKAVISVGEALREKIHQDYQLADILLLPNFIDTTLFSTIGNKEDFDKFTFVSVGSLEPNKGMDILLAAYSHFKRNNPEAVTGLVIVGDGQERKVLEQQTVVLGISDEVKFVGWVKNVELPELFNRCDVYVSASRVETFGIAPIEAMSCGLPAIVTESGGPEYFVNKQNGVVVKNGDVAMLARAMGCMLKNYDSYNQDIVRKTMTEKFDKEVVVRRLLDIYRNILTKK